MKKEGGQTGRRPPLNPKEIRPTGARRGRLLVMIVVVEGRMRGGGLDVLMGKKEEGMRGFDSLKIVPS